MEPKEEVPEVVENEVDGAETNEQKSGGCCCCCGGDAADHTEEINVDENGEVTAAGEPLPTVAAPAGEGEGESPPAGEGEAPPGEGEAPPGEGEAPPASGGGGLFCCCCCGGTAEEAANEINLEDGAGEQGAPEKKSTMPTSEEPTPQEGVAAEGVAAEGVAAEEAKPSGRGCCSCCCGGAENEAEGEITVGQEGVQEGDQPVIAVVDAPGDEAAKPEEGAEGPTEKKGGGCCSCLCCCCGSAAEEAEKEKTEEFDATAPESTPAGVPDLPTPAMPPGSPVVPPPLAAGPPPKAAEPATPATPKSEYKPEAKPEPAAAMEETEKGLTKEAKYNDFKARFPEATAQELSQWSTTEGCYMIMDETNNKFYCKWSTESIANALAFFTVAPDVEAPARQMQSGEKISLLVERGPIKKLLKTATVAFCKLAAKYEGTFTLLNTIVWSRAGLGNLEVVWLNNDETLTFCKRDTHPVSIANAQAVCAVDNSFRLQGAKKRRIQAKWTKPAFISTVRSITDSAAGEIDPRMKAPKIA